MPTPAPAPVSAPAAGPAPGSDRPVLVTTLLVALSALPVAALVIPHTMSYVLAFALGDLHLRADQAAALFRAGGMALPAVLLAVPPAALAARRLPPWTVVMTGLFCVLAGALAVRAAGSVPLIGLARALQGAGAGAIVPATLVMVWDRGSRLLVAAWSGLLAGALLMAMPVALRALPVARAGTDTAGAGPVPGWRGVLHPPLWLVGAALLCVAAHVLTAHVFTKSRQGRAAGPEDAAGPAPRRSSLLLPVVPAAGFAFLAIVTTYDRWSEGSLLVVAGIGFASLLGLAVAGSRGAGTGAALRCAVVMLGTGMLALPVAAPVAGLISTRVAAQDLPLTPFAAGAAAALLAAAATVRVRGDGARAAVLAGQGLVVVAVLVFLTTGPDSGTALLTAAVVPLGAGLGLALAAALWDAGPGPGLFALTLCFPAVLVGYLVMGPLQVIQMNAARAAGGGRGELVFALTAAYRQWLIVAGVVAVLMAGLTAVAGQARDRRPTTGGQAAGRRRASTSRVPGVVRPDPRHEGSPGM